ncbi:hypothetical protein AGABI2DRAFT_177540 [Agaricus bisporus var. bisporus H97]|uniref:hypothetical protein n=1 Tax=Agaricus bisporus var. bisporus (strain H97 / ATCC MYA-4626 / FGSC 10389) TaxID=936046 RepID=UPI00029F6F08|nr:hypothetical protein AGABI2DRAFT_177540 [Agaricus bisporus var. bisporus H97]EKV49621.1 hypothetical protein AGABI2DRAFT_177540 [Agaricus bisporus var. bisporus H97]
MHIKLIALIVVATAVIAAPAPEGVQADVIDNHAGPPETTGTRVSTVARDDHVQSPPESCDPHQHMSSTDLFSNATSTAHKDFDIDKHTGFVPARRPLVRLPSAWKEWEEARDAAVSARLQLAEVTEKADEKQRDKEKAETEKWRASIRKMSVLSIDELKESKEKLILARHLLTFLLHCYAHTIPTIDPIVIPRSISVPLLQTSKILQHPPVLTYFDENLNNWDCPEKGKFPPSINDLRCRTTFTGTTDEAEFHLTLTRIELRGGEALELMRLALVEAVHGNENGPAKVTDYLERATIVIQELREILLRIKNLMDPDLFYNKIRPWLSGGDGDTGVRPWIFEGKDEVGEWPGSSELSGLSAAQSPIIQVLDAYLGIESARGKGSYATASGKKPFLERMRSYMALGHRTFLSELRAYPRQIRTYVQTIAEQQGSDSPVVHAYNIAVKALKDLRDSHMVIVTLFVIGPARRVKNEAAAMGAGSASSAGDEGNNDQVKGTGGTELVKFLKGVREQTADAILQFDHD